MPPTGAALWRTLCAHQVYGANTNVGKTIVSTALCNAVQRSPSQAGFLKPVSTGPLDEADDRHVKRFASGVLTKCLYQFDDPVSPHIASRKQGVLHDEDVLTGVHEALSNWAQNGVSFGVVETAGGVHSPGPNGNSQADLYRSLRLPIILVADSRLGGISSSISAYESLLLRGYDVHSVLVFRDDYYKNHDYLRYYFNRKSIPLVPLPQPPPRPAGLDADSQARDEEALAAYYSGVARESDVQGLLESLSTKNAERIDRLESMAGRAHDAIWYPFTQHHGMTAKDITVIDSAYEDYFQTYNPNSTKPGDGKLQATFDGSASWWTQGLGHGNPDLSLSAAYAAGRYGHVMFAGSVHEPALKLAEMLLEKLGNPRFQKVFYTDNGSTGMEVAVKMGLRATCHRYGWDASKEGIDILGLKGSYHGDTIGVMDCSEPSTFNKKVEWYRGRGHWFDFPQVKMTKGTWVVEVPEGLRDSLGPDLKFTSLNSIFDLGQRLESDASKRYQEYIKNEIQNAVQQQGKKFGSLIIEPIILGAGGMLLCDPLFQRCLIDVVRNNPQLFSQESTITHAANNNNNNNNRETTSWSGLPVIFDEVFVGLYRLGRITAASFLDTDADIAVNAKLLTGGLLPLCTTVASKDIFDAFSSPEKSDALLHGHSYTAHAVGCTVAAESLRSMMDLDSNGSWNDYRRNWMEIGPEKGNKADELVVRDSDASHNSTVWSVWSHDFVRDLSHAESVDGLFALGTVLSISLRDTEGGGYTSTAAKGLQQALAVGTKEFNVHSRVLGNVLYLMASTTSKTASLRELEKLLRAALL